MAKQVHLLDYGAGNVLSVVNAIKAGGFDVKIVTTPDELQSVEKLVFPGVGAFGSCMERLNSLGFTEPLKEYLRADKPFFGICLGMQTLFESSDESPGTAGLGVIPGSVSAFDPTKEVPGLSVPHMGWNGLTSYQKSSPVLTPEDLESRFYFVHSFKALPTKENAPWVLTTTDYGVEFISSIQRGNIVATQFHPEKSGVKGLGLLKRFLELPSTPAGGEGWFANPSRTPTTLAKRVIACLDVRSNDAGDLVVTKGDQYDVREKDDGGDVRNLGKPVALAHQYYLDGADEVTFLNITSFRSSPLKDQPMLEVLKQSSAKCFVPLTIGGGIQDLTEPDGTKRGALEVASEYFRSGADKVSIGSDAVRVAEDYIRTGEKTGSSSIEQIARVYGKQAVVISVDPKRVYVNSPSDVAHHTIKCPKGPNGEEYCWYQCTIKGGRETRDLGVYELARACEALGAGEILLNCIDKDGTNSGYDHDLIRMVKESVGIPVIASSGAGCPEHFEKVYEATACDAALAAGIFHRKEVPLPVVKEYLKTKTQIPIR